MIGIHRYIKMGNCVFQKFCLDDINKKFLEPFNMSIFQSNPFCPISFQVLTHYQFSEELYFFVQKKRVPVSLLDYDALYVIQSTSLPLQFLIVCYFLPSLTCIENFIIFFIVTGGIEINRRSRFGG
jgi:hypothetical protein